MIVLANICGCVVKANDMGVFGTYECIAVRLDGRIVWLQWDYQDMRYVAE